MIETYLIAIAIATLGILLISFFLLWVGVLLVMAAIGLVIRKHFPRDNREKGVRSFWAFDRPEKGEWEDVDRIIRR